jgi:hypothetical protein
MLYTKRVHRAEQAMACSPPHTPCTTGSAPCHSETAAHRRLHKYAHFDSLGWTFSMRSRIYASALHAQLAATLRPQRQCRIPAFELHWCDASTGVCACCLVHTEKTDTNSQLNSGSESTTQASPSVTQQCNTTSCKTPCSTVNQARQAASTMLLARRSPFSTWTPFSLRLQAAERCHRRWQVSQRARPFDTARGQ